MEALDLVPDWRDQMAYRPLLGADRSLFAWEWLRRAPAYRQAWKEARTGSGEPGDAARAAEAFGLVDFEAPERAVPEARPCWRAGIFSYVLQIEPADDLPPSDRVDFDGLGDMLERHVIGRREHFLLSDGVRLIRLDGAAGDFGPGAVGLRYRISGVKRAQPPLLALRRLLALCRSGGFSASLHPPEARAGRWILMLRAHDALAAGAHQREIAEALLSRAAADARWRTRDPSLRSRTQRLVRSARHLHGGGWRAFLD